VEVKIKKVQIKKVWCPDTQSYVGWKNRIPQQQGNHYLASKAGKKAWGECQLINIGCIGLGLLQGKKFLLPLPVGPLLAIMEKCREKSTIRV